MPDPTATFAAALLVLRCRHRIALRRLRERAFELLVLGPMVIGALGWVGARYLDILRPLIADWLAAPADPLSLPALVLALPLVPILWPGSLEELYGHGPLDGLPVPEASRLAVTLAASAGRALAPTVVLWAALWVLAGRRPLPIEAAAVLAACVLLSWLTVLLAAVLVHRRMASVEGLMVLGAVTLGLAASPARSLLAPWGVAGAALHGAFAGGLGVRAPRCVSTDGVFLGTLALVAVALGAAHLRWRRQDLEVHQQRRQRRRRESWLAGALTSLLPDRSPGPLVALVRRDLRLVTRRFSPAVPLCVGLTLSFLGVMVGLGVDGALAVPELWRRVGMVVAGVLAVLSTAAVVPFLLRAQLPVFWLEKVTGVALEHVWRTKVAVAMLLALPTTCVAVALLLLLAPGDVTQKALATAQLVSAAAVVASFVGLACFEIAAEPLIGVVWSGALGLSLMALFVFYPGAFWLGILAYGWAAGKLAERASRRVRFTEVLS